MKLPPLASALLVLAAAPGCVPAQDPIAIVVFNYAGAPHSVMAAAVETARMAFRAAAIDAVWTVCEAETCPGTPPEDGRYYELMLMPRLRGAMAGHPAGYAMTGGGFPRPRGYAFYDAVRSVADRTVRPEELVLGCVLVHEAGHLLGLRHERHGAMRPNLEAADMDEVARGRGFTAEEGKQLRAAARR